MQRKRAAAEAMSSTDRSAVEALAGHLGVAPEDIVDWVHGCGGLPPKVLLAWICAWNRERQAGPASPGSGRADETPAT